MKDPRRSETPPELFAAGSSTNEDAAAAARELQGQLGSIDPRMVLFFSGGERDLGALAAAVSARFPKAISAGCTTCGEIGPAGCAAGSVASVALGAPLVAAAKLIDELRSFRFADGEELVARLCAGLGSSPGKLTEDPGRFVLITLTDGLSGMEEILIASLATYAPEVPLVGGSAGDDFRFEATRVAVNGRAERNAAAVILLEPGVPFHTFQAHHYTPGEESLVVTEADPERRLIRRIDGRPALEALARLLDIPSEKLAEQGFEALSRHQVVFGFRAGSELYMRSVMNLTEGALLMGGAVEEGTVLLPMRAGDLVAATREGLQRALAQVPGAAGALLFNCGGRLLEATQAGRLAELSEALVETPAAGFTTYGEQFGPMQVNHTLTGLVLGRGNG